MYKGLKIINIFNQDNIARDLEWFYKSKWRTQYLVMTCIKHAFYCPSKTLHIAAFLKQIYISGIDIYNFVLENINPSSLSRLLYLNGFFSKKDVEFLVKKNGDFAFYFMTEIHIHDAQFLRFSSHRVLKIVNKLKENNYAEFQLMSDLGYKEKSIENTFFKDDVVMFAFWFLRNTSSVLQKQIFITLNEIADIDLYGFSMYCGSEAIFKYLTEIGCRASSPECLNFAVHGGSVEIISTICNTLGMGLDPSHFDILLKLDHNEAIKFFYEKQKTGLNINSVIRFNSLLGIYLLQPQFSQDLFKYAIESKSFNVLMYIIDKTHYMTLMKNPSNIRELLNYIILNDMTDMLELLFSRGISPNILCPFNLPIIYYAIEVGSLAFTKIIAEAGADLNAYLGKTPLGYAIEKGKKDIEDFLKSIGATS